MCIRDRICIERPGNRAESAGFRWTLVSDYYNISFAELATIMLPSGMVQGNTSLALLSKIVQALQKTDTTSVHMVADDCKPKLMSIAFKAQATAAGKKVGAAAQQPALAAAAASSASSVKHEPPSQQPPGKKARAA